MSNDTEIKNSARAFARETLANSPAFRDLDRGTQFKMYNDLVNQRMGELQAGNGLARGMSGLPVRRGGRNTSPEDAGDLLNPELHRNDNLDRAGARMGDFVDKVDFPAFVRDLLKGVFDANLDVAQKQMQSYQAMLKEATRDLAHFINQIDNTAAFGYLVESKSNEFGMDFGDMDEEGEQTVILTDKEGNKVDTEDSKIKGMIMNAKIQMAKEHRAMLREVLLMGVTRLVVEKGVVEASVLFEIKSSSTKAMSENARINRQKDTKSFKAGVAPIPFLPSFGRTATQSQETQISIASMNSTQKDDLSAKLAGSVKIEFKSDYFKLDNFAKMYGGLTDDDIAEAKQGTTPAQK